MMDKNAKIYVAGHRGMVGSAIVFEQGGASFVVCLKDWESHEVELVENEVLCTYDFAPQQMSLL